MDSQTAVQEEVVSDNELDNQVVDEDVESGSEDDQFDDSEGRSAPTTSPINTSRLYIGNLSWDTTWQALKDYMRKSGEVLYAKIFEAEYGRSKGCGIVEYATVEEARKAHAELNDTQLDGRMIFIREDREDKDFGRNNNSGGGGRGRRGGRGRGGRGRGRYRGGGGGGGFGGHANYAGRMGDDEEQQSSGKQLFVNNLSWGTDWQGLKSHFQQVDDAIVLRADVAYSPRGSRSRGYGTVLFETQEGASRAIDVLDGTELDGRPILVRLDRYA